MDLSDPVFFMGSSFGEFYQSLHKLGKYEEMLLYTSVETKNKFAEDELISFFKNMQFSYPLKLKAISADDASTLLYETQIGATNKTIQFLYKIENDTCKAFFNDLDVNSPFIGI
jgi:hypothetical protein